MAITGLCISFGATPASAAGKLPDPIISLPNVTQPDGTFGLVPGGAASGPVAFCKPETPAPSPSVSASAAPEESTAPVVNNSASPSASPAPEDEECFALPQIKFIPPAKDKPCDPIKFSIVNPNSEMVPFQLWVRLQLASAPVELTVLVGAFLGANFNDSGEIDFTDTNTQFTLSVWAGLWHGTKYQINYPTPLNKLFVDPTKCPKPTPAAVPRLVNRDGSSATQRLQVQERPVTNQPAPATSAPAAPVVVQPEANEAPGAGGGTVADVGDAVAYTPASSSASTVLFNGWTWAFVVGIIAIIAFFFRENRRQQRLERAGAHRSRTNQD